MTREPCRTSELKAKPDALLAEALKHLKSAALAAALVAAPSIASADPILLITSSATMTSGDAANPWRYVYTLTNQSTASERLEEFLVPLFSTTDADFGLTATSCCPFTREDSFVTGGFFYDPAADPALAANPAIYGPNPNAFVGVGGIWWHFNQNPLLVGQSMELSFNSAYAPTNAPYMAVFALGTMPVTPIDTFGGPIAMPNSPAYQATQTHSVPEPATLLLLAPAATVLLRRRRQT